MNWVKNILAMSIGLATGVVIIVAGMFIRFERLYSTSVYPGIATSDLDLSGKTASEIDTSIQGKSVPFAKTALTFSFENYVATISGEQLAIAYDGSLISKQAFDIGRSGNMFSDGWFHVQSFLYSAGMLHDEEPLVLLPLPLAYNHTSIDEKLEYASSFIDTTPVEPQFEFDQKTNRVTTFKLGKDGRALNRLKAKDAIDSEIQKNPGTLISLQLPVETVSPNTDTSDIDNLGIVELLSTGESYFTDSIPGRIYNIELAASRVNGVLVAPGETLSFNDTIGDITAATGYKSAYVIKQGKTILDDGGGVCQVSTTLFRAALNAGLEIVDREPHSYRVSFYEQGGFKPGLDATVYPPYTDLKVKNNTEDYVLFQSEFDEKAKKLTYRIYGKHDGRVVELSDMRTWDYAAPPPAVYQEDPTLTTGTIKQIEHAIPGLKTAFDYKVTKNDAVLSDQTIKSVFTPWRAVYLYGPGTPVPTQ